MYAHEPGEDLTLWVGNAAQEKLRRAEGFGDPPAEILILMKWKNSVEPTPVDGSEVVSTEYPKLLAPPRLSYRVAPPAC
jgi:hypothetical protein